MGLEGYKLLPVVISRSSTLIKFKKICDKFWRLLFLSNHGFQRFELVKK